MARSNAEAEAPPDDAELMRASRQQPEQFAGIFRRYFAEVHRYVARRVGVEAAGDVVAESFLEAFRSRERFDPDRGGVRPWLYGIATNRIGSHRRAERRYLAVLARTHAEGFAEDHGDRVGDRVDAGSAGDVLARALADLPDADRDVLLLVALADLSYGETARALGIPEGTVASRLNRARRKLREALDDNTRTRTSRSG